MSETKVTYCLLNNLGGITTMLQNLVRFRGSDSLAQEAVVLNVKEIKLLP